MIKENVKLVNSTTRFVTKICDECGKEDISRMSVIIKGRQRRKGKIDLCKKCSNSTKYKFTVFSKTMEKAVNWTGGKLVDRGYSRIYIGNGKRKFEHVILFEEWIGRELKKKECLHHIDLDKSNNDIKNLYLCHNMKEHGKCHANLELIAFAIFEKEIWFNRNLKQYFLNKQINEYIKDCAAIVGDKKIHILKRKRNGQIKRYYCYFSNKRRVYEHVLLIEQQIGRKLFRDEVVHHIDGNSLNNNINNLILLTRDEHSRLHHSLQNCAAELLKSQKIKFSDGIYRSC